MFQKVLKNPAPPKHQHKHFAMLLLPFYIQPVCSPVYMYHFHFILITTTVCQAEQIQVSSQIYACSAFTHPNVLYL